MLFEITKYLDVISPLLLLMFFLVKEKTSSWGDYIFLYITAQTIINGIAIIYDKVLLRENLFLYHVNCLTSVLILSGFFSSILEHKKFKKSIPAINIAFCLFFVVNVTRWESLHEFNSNSFSVASLIITTFSFVYYLENLMQPADFKIAQSRTFWFVTGLFTYYASSFFIFVTYRKLTLGNVRYIGILWQTHNVLFLMLCMYLFVGILCKPSREKYSS